MWLGHSGTNMTEKHYREGVRAVESEAWFNVLPGKQVINLLFLLTSFSGCNN